MIDFIGDKILELKENEKQAPLPGDDKHSPFDPPSNSNITLQEFYSFLQQTFLQNTLVERPLDIETIPLYSDLFRIVISIKGSLRKIDEKNENGNIFDAIAEYLNRSTQNNPILVKGIPGSGKSFFLQTIYFYLEHLNKEGRFSKIPIYVDIDSYNESKNLEEALHTLNLQFETIRDFCSKNRDKEYLFIIDGFDDYFRSGKELEARLQELIQSINIKKTIIGLSVIEKNRSYHNGTSGFHPESEIAIDNLSTKSAEFGDFVNKLIDINHRSESKSEKKVKKQQVIDKIKELGIPLIDFYIVSFVSKQIEYVKPANSTSELYKMIALSEIHQNQYLVINQNTTSEIEKCAELAFASFIKGILPNDASRIGNTHWKVINKHFPLRDFFLAYHVISKLLLISKDFDEGIEPNKKMLDNFKYVYPYDVNKYCKDIMNETNDSSKKVLYAITYVYEKVNITSQTHFAYLLGRIKNPQLKNDARSFLSKILKEKNIQPGTATFYAINEKEALYIRTMYISLCFLGDKKSKNEYLDIIITDKKWNNINRGFHLEYYGDIKYNPADDLALNMSDHCETPFDLTFWKLNDKLETSIKRNAEHELFEIELFTICSLFQNRHIDNPNAITADHRNAIEQLISSVLKRGRLSNQNLEKYLYMLKYYVFEKQVSSYCSFLIDAYKLKVEKRKGWNTPKRTVPQPESVGEHIYGTILIAKYYLPDMLENNPDYSKEKIIDILLFHDLSEAYTGDIIDTEKTDQHREEEKKFIDNVSMLSTYTRMGNLYSLSNNWEKFERLGSNNADINFSIAKDIDKLENLMQLFIYQSNPENKIEDFEYFKSSLIRTIRTDIGRGIKDMMLDHFER